MTCIVETSNLGKKYGTTRALEDVSLNVDNGDFLAIIGPSGSGKSTLLRLMGLIEPPSSGKIVFKGSDASSASEEKRLEFRREIGMVFQDAILFNTTVYKNIAYPLKIRRRPQSEVNRQINEALDAVGLRGLESRHASELSGGEAQRVSLAQALVYGPALLLLDEPTANLDPRNAALIENVVSRTNHEEGTTTVIATHNIQQVQFLASKGAILREGKLTEEGRISELFGSPSAFLSSFALIGNVFSGTSEMAADGLAMIDVGASWKIEATTRKSGKVKVVIRPEDIIVSREPVYSSARNLLKGRVVEALRDGQKVRIRVNAEKEFLVTMTTRSFEEMKLEPGSLVFLAFKASSVNVI